MGKLKVALSILALLVMGAAGVTSFGNWQVPGPISELLATGGMLLAWLGYQPFQIPEKLSRVFAILQLTAASFVTSHAVAWGDGGKHAALIVVAFVGALFGVLARGLVPRPAQAAATPPPVPNT